jgi:hypothetical protein
LLVHLDTGALDGHPIPLRLGVTLYRGLDGLYFLWQDLREVVFDERDHAVDALTDREAARYLRNRFALTLVRATKVIARLAGPGLPPVQRVRHTFATGAGEWAE